MKRKSLNVLKLKGILPKDKKISETYLKLKLIISKYKAKSLVIAISGGPDSMALAALCKALQLEKKYKIYFVLIDHNIRKNSYKEAIKFKKILIKKNISLNILKNKKKINNNIQKNARDIRYDLLTKFCNQKKVRYLVTAHHQDDQIETFLIRLSRGSGVEGLSGMNERTYLSNGTVLLRPFLDIKKEILVYISKKVFKKIIKDPSNTNKKFLRTNIRELKKILEKKGLDFDKILRSIKNISSSKEAINFYVLKSIKKIVKFKNKKASLNLKKFANEPKEIKFKIFNTLLKNTAKSYYPPRSRKVLNLIRRFENKSFTKSTLGGCIFERKKNFLLISREF